MLLSEFLQTRTNSVSTADALSRKGNGVALGNKTASAEENGGITFAETLRNEIERCSKVEFSSHAMKRIELRSIDISTNDKLARLNKGVEIAAGKGSEESLILVDSTAFVVSVKNNRVITTMSREDLMGNIFTNIDSAVII